MSGKVKFGPRLKTRNLIRSSLHGRLNAIAIDPPSSVRRAFQLLATVIVIAGAILLIASHNCNAQTGASARALTGQAALSDWRADVPGVVRRLSVKDLPPPYATRSVVNAPDVVKRPNDAMPKVPDGFRVNLLVSGLRNPREIRVAPKGDVFVAESAAGRIRVLRLSKDGARVTENSIYASGLSMPFGIAFYPTGANPRYVYVANTDSVVRFPYRSGDLKAREPAQPVLRNIPGYGSHWTRDVVFSADGSAMFVSVGSASNASAPRPLRADILVSAPDGSGMHVYAGGLRNPVGLAIDPHTGALWCAVNERDGLGDNLVPDYVTHVTKGGFYGWPWFYLGAHRDPRHPRAHPELAHKVLVPDVLIASHSAPLGITFYTASAFPEKYRGGMFVALHGSWNRSRPTGYKVIYVPIHGGIATGEYIDFMTGFFTRDDKVWGRPVGVAVAKDGALLVTDDASDSIWRVSYAGSHQKP